MNLKLSLRTSFNLYFREIRLKNEFVSLPEEFVANRMNGREFTYLAHPENVNSGRRKWKGKFNCSEGTFRLWSFEYSMQIRDELRQQVLSLKTRSPNAENWSSQWPTTACSFPVCLLQWSLSFPKRKLVGQTSNLLIPEGQRSWGWKGVGEIRIIN